MGRQGGPTLTRLEGTIVRFATGQRSESHSKVMDLTGGAGVDVAIEAVEIKVVKPGRLQPKKPVWHPLPSSAGRVSLPEPFQRGSALIVQRQGMTPSASP
jgi:hypothetical protein